MKIMMNRFGRLLMTALLTTVCMLSYGKNGDANGDNTVNVADIVEIVNYIMGNVSEGTFSFILTDDWDGNENIINGKFRLVF